MIQMAENASRYDWVEEVDGKLYLVRQECGVCGFKYPKNMTTCTKCAREAYLKKSSDKG